MHGSVQLLGTVRLLVLLPYIDNEDISLLSSTIIPKNTVKERTKINLSENSLKRQTILSNHDSDDSSTDNEQMEQIVSNNPAENVNPKQRNGPT